MESCAGRDLADTCGGPLRAEHKKEKKEKKRKGKKEKKKKEKKRDKKEKRHSAVEQLRETASGSSWGKYGIVREGDMYSKQEEFLAWLSEVKGVPQDACGQRELKEHFSDFCEDYNTATMPSTKYYNMATWYAEEKARAAKGQGAPLPPRAKLELSAFFLSPFLLLPSPACGSAACSSMLQHASHACLPPIPA